MKKATYIEACIMVSDTKNIAQDDPNGAAYTTVYSALERTGFDMDLFGYCPLNEGNNAAIYNQIGASRYPILRLYAKYEDGTEAGYVFSAAAIDYAKSNIEKTDWDLEGKALDKYIKALSTGNFGQESDAILCKIFPPICQLSKLVLGGVLVYTLYRAAEARSTTGKVVWGGAGVLAGQAFLKN